MPRTRVSDSAGTRPRKRVKLSAPKKPAGSVEKPSVEEPIEANAPQVAEVAGPSAQDTSKNATNAVKARLKINKLAPSRPWPTVPTSVSATVPRSVHKEGKNFICITRKTPLGMYLRRCKGVILEDGHKTLHLSAMGAAIPHLMLLALSLPSILPNPPDEIHSEITTGTVEVQDEVLPEDDDEDITYRTRGKSTLMVVFKIGDGVDEGPSKVNKKQGKGTGGKRRRRGRGGAADKSKEKQDATSAVFQEPEQDNAGQA